MAIHRIAMVGGLSVLLAGCTSSGLSPREVHGQDYSTYVYSMYDAPANAAPAKPVQLPATVAVAQIGEVAPPTAMLDVLRKDQQFSLVQSVPGVDDVAAQADVPPDRVIAAKREARVQSDRMLRYARDLGTRYLFLFGGTVDRSTTGTRMSLADVTIVGAFIVPSKSVKGEARASGSLIDVETGRVILSVSADSSKEILSATAAQDGNEIKMLHDLRDDVTVKLARQLTQRIKEKSALGG